MSFLRPLSRLIAFGAVAFVLGGCHGGDSRPATPPPASPSDYRSRLGDPNVSEQEKETIRRAMADSQQQGKAPDASGRTVGENQASSGGK
jgi:hypothetical protein